MSRIIVVAFVLGLSASGLSQEKKSDPKDFAKQSQPGPEHERLAAFVGKWELTADGVGGKGKAEFKTILGGRFLTEESSIPLGGGVAMEWQGIYGFDKSKKKYTAVWVDNMDTTTETGEGDAEDSGKAIMLRGEHIDPRTGKPAKFAWRLARDGEALTIEMFEGDRKVFAMRGTKMK